MKKRLLIIQDEHDLCEIFRTKFQKIGIDVSVAHDGREGFASLLSRRPDGILLDIRMREGDDGITFLRRLRRHRDEAEGSGLGVHKIPVLVITAGDERMKPVFEAEGISGYVTMPFDSRDLSEQVVRLLSSEGP
ncbi:MAG: response regulator [Candidatus Omnitrophota bacterium]|nr:response regulator [Candidatus Omnitrophota bacterium]